MIRRLSPRFPFDPARLPFFYGWVLVAAGTAGVILSLPGQTMGVSVFTDDLLRVTGLSRLQFSISYLIGTLMSGLLLPAAGRLLDRVGVRAMGGAACLGLAGTLVLLSYVDVLASVLPFGALLAPFLALTFTFSLLRFSGQGMLTLTARTMMARWFDRRRGLITALSGSLVSFGFSLAPLVLLAWIETSGWRGAWRQMAVVLAAMGLISVLLYRDDPEECGLRVDGLRAPPRPVDPGTVVATHEYTRRQALATPVFWVLTLAIALIAMVGTGIMFHILDLGAQAGIEDDRIVRIFLPISLISVATGFVVGYLIDRRPVLFLARFMLVCELVLFVAAAHVGALVPRLVMIASWGMAAGFYGPMTGAALPRLFGRLHLGAIAGAMTSVLVIASALGPAVLALFRQLTGSYGPGLYICCSLPLAVLLLSRRVE